LGGLNNLQAELFFVARNENSKKEEFPGLMENMLPGNSFPQICVVSVHKSVENKPDAQDYQRSVATGNVSILLIGNGTA
jgi:hypothetical protein